MSDSTPENETTRDAGTDTGSGSGDQPAGAITDEQLPDDLRPDKNPMARDPDSDDGEPASETTGPSPAGDPGQPG